MKTQTLLLLFSLTLVSCRSTPEPDLQATADSAIQLTNESQNSLPSTPETIAQPEGLTPLSPEAEETGEPSQPGDGPDLGQDAVNTSDLKWIPRLPETVITAMDFLSGFTRVEYEYSYDMTQTSQDQIVEHYLALLEEAGFVLVKKANQGVDLHFETLQRLGESGINQVELGAVENVGSIGTGKIYLRVTAALPFNPSDFERGIFGGFPPVEDAVNTTDLALIPRLPGTFISAMDFLNDFERVDFGYAYDRNAISDHHIIEYYRDLLESAGFVLVTKGDLGVDLQFESNRLLGESGINQVFVGANQSGESIGTGEITLNVTADLPFSPRDFESAIFPGLPSAPDAVNTSDLVLIPRLPGTYIQYMEFLNSSTRLDYEYAYDRVQTSDQQIIEYFQTLLENTGFVLVRQEDLGVCLRFESDQPVGRSGIQEILLGAIQNGDSIGTGKIFLSVTGINGFNPSDFLSPITIP